MSNQEETLLEPTEEIVENSEIEDEEYGSETGSNIEEDELTTVGGELPDIDELEDDDFDDEYMEDETFGLDNMGALLGSVLTNEEGETVCSALVNISRQLEVQNKIMIKMLAQLQKRV